MRSPCAEETICTIATDKATNDFECLDEGYIAKVLVPYGAEDLVVSVPIAILVDGKRSPCNSHLPLCLPSSYSHQDSVANLRDFTAVDAAKKPADVVKAGIASPPDQPPLNSPSVVKTNAPFCSENDQMAQPPAPTPAVTSAPPMMTTPSSSDGSRIAASPFAKKRASEASIQLVMP